jgi:hypothetical protein
MVALARKLGEQLLDVLADVRPQLVEAILLGLRIMSSHQAHRAPESDVSRVAPMSSRCRKQVRHRVLIGLEDLEMKVFAVPRGPPRHIHEVRNVCSVQKVDVVRPNVLSLQRL